MTLISELISSILSWTLVSTWLSYLGLLEVRKRPLLNFLCGLLDKTTFYQFKMCDQSYLKSIAVPHLNSVWFVWVLSIQKESTQ